MTIDEIKAKISTLEKGLANPQISEAIKEGMKKGIEKLKKDVEALEGSAEKKVEKADDKIEDAEKKVKEADTKAEKKEAQADLKDAKDEKKEAVAEVKEIATVVEKVEKAEKKAKVWGGAGRGQGRKPSGIPKMPKEKGKRGGYRAGAGRKNKKASSTTKMVKPSGYKPRKDTPVFVKRKVVKKIKKAITKAVKKAEVKKVGKVKSVRAFGQKVEYKNNSEFCAKLISAFKKRKAVSKKLGKKKTRPVFGVITSHIKDAVTRAIDNTPKKSIEANPKAFLAKAQRLEKSAIRFLEDFKAILGTDFKKSEISAEFGDLEKSITKLVSKYKK